MYFVPYLFNNNNNNSRLVFIILSETNVLQLNIKQADEINIHAHCMMITAFNYVIFQNCIKQHNIVYHYTRAFVNSYFEQRNYFTLLKKKHCFFDIIFYSNIGPRETIVSSIVSFLIALNQQGDFKESITTYDRFYYCLFETKRYF